MYVVRLNVFRIVLASVFVAFVLSLPVAKTIASPLRDLRKRASRMVERRQELGSLFQDSRRHDEIGDLERALAELSKRLGDRIRFIESFASDLSHELKNPLASIRTATELLRDVDDPEDRKRFLEIIEADVARMENLISRVREVTFIDSSIEKESRVPLCLNQFVKEFVEGFELLHGSRVTLKFSDLAPPLYVEVCPDRLTQVMENLLDNAISFTPKDSPVVVSLLQEQPWAVVSVTDHGPGIIEEDRERIFDRFFSRRSGEERSGRHHVGLGLAIVKAVIEGYGGKVEAKNALDGGAVFEFRLAKIPHA